jgi:hypothetical protein
MAEVETSREGAVLTITLNRPDVLNAFNTEMHKALAVALKEARSPDVRAVVITGAGRGFCVGQDLTEFREASGDIGSRLRETYHPNVFAIRALEKPVIAAVNGAAAGAGEREACTGGGSVHGRDHRLLERPDRGDVRVVAAAQAGADVAGLVAEFAQILADAEAASGACDDHRADVVAAGLLERHRERPVHRRVERVEDVRSVERDRQHRALAGRLDLNHGREPKGLRREPIPRC